VSTKKNLLPKQGTCFDVGVLSKCQGFSVSCKSVYRRVKTKCCCTTELYKTGTVRITLTLSCFRATTVAVEMQSECVCVALGIHYETRIRQIVIYGMSGSTAFFRIIL
jgi:hypothetical protein